MLAELRSTPRGLTTTEAVARIVAYGRNVIPGERTSGVVTLFARQFLDPLIYVLIGAAVISAATRSWSDTILILVVLIVNATIGTIQEFGAQRSAKALQSLVVSRARVVRDGMDREIASEEMVPGDVVILESGTRVPADARLLSGGPIEVDESLLTGESVPATKRADGVLASRTALGDRSNMAFAGTLVTHGRAHAVTVATGLSTQLGQIASSVASADLAAPPLLVRMRRFSRRIAVVVGAAVLVIGAVDLARGASGADVLLLVVALAVSAIPEGLPVALTVALSIGARRMARRKVIARRLVAVEALGSCTCIASDKTGTLTMNQLTVGRIALAGRVPFEVTGAGTDPVGSVVLPEGAVDDLVARAQLRRLGEAAAHCNDGFLGMRDGAWAAHGDAVDVALLVMAHKLGITGPAMSAAASREAEIPYEPERQYAASLDRAADGLRVSAKGAAERIVPMCSRMATPRGDVPIDPDALQDLAHDLAARGYRVLAVAAGPCPSGSGKEFGPDRLHDLVFLGFVGMIDPLRPEARDSVAACRKAGIGCRWSRATIPSRRSPSPARSGSPATRTVRSPET